MEHKIILKCRTCLEDNEEGSMYDLFFENDIKSTGQQQHKLKLNKKIEFCCGVRIRQSTNMPTKICWKCFEMTRMWYNFRQMCLNSQLYLESLCEDRIRPPGQDDAEFLEFLMEELQVQRDKIYDPKENLESKIENDDDDDDGDGEDIINGNIGLDLGLLVDEKELGVGDDVFIETDDLERPSIKEEPQFGEDTSIISKTISTSTKNLNIRASAKKQKHTGIKRKYRPPSPTSYMCSICGNVYNKRATFAYHMLLHNNVKPHECEICGKAFRQLCELKNHMRRHTGERPYKCSFCDRHFIDRSEKHRHERVHTNTRPYTCNICGKSFSYSAILKNHMKLHTGKKDFNCMVCDKAFTLQHQLKAHLQTLTHKQKEQQYVSAGYEVIYE